MAVENDSLTGENTKTIETGVAHRVSRRASKIARRTPTSRPARAKRPKRTAKPIRSLLILSLVGGLIVSIALPAFSMRAPAAEAMTLQQVAIDDAQSLVVASDAAPEGLTRSSYDATTQEEIDKKKAEEAAAERARQLAAAVAAGGYTGSIDLSMTSPGSGEVRWPVVGASWPASYNLFQPPDRPNHNGLDMMIGSGSPIFAATAGVVRESTEGGSSYGVMITIDGVVGGQSVHTLYAHMSYGTRLVSAGDYVAAGQLIGQVGQTGNATAPHLHFEVEINGTLVDPLAWLNANAG